jgi:hypothetical protein
VTLPIHALKRKLNLLFFPLRWSLAPILAVDIQTYYRVSHFSSHGLAVTRDLPVALQKARQKVKSFLVELRRTPRFSNLNIELRHGHVRVNNKALGPEYLWPNAILAGKDKLFDLIGLSEFCTCSNWDKGLWHDDLVQLNLDYFAAAGSVQEL